MTWVATGTAAMTAAEIAAAEAAMAAAATAAAEAAAASAASTAASTAAASAAAPAITEVAATALPEVAGSVLPEVAGSILEAAPGVVPPPATPLPPAGLEQVGQAAVPATPLPPTTPTPPAGIEQIGQQGFTQAELNAINAGQADAMAAQGTGTQVAGPAMNVTSTPTGPEVVSASQTTPESINAAAKAMESVPTNTNPFIEGFNSVSNYVDKNPFKSAVLGYTGLNLMGAFNQPSAPIPEKRKYSNQYTLSPNFRSSSPEPNVYRPSYASGGIAGMQNSYDDENGSDMASGGIASFAKGTPRQRDPEADFARYYALMEGKAPEQPPAPSYVGRVGIAYDDDKDTRYEDPLTAALIRQGKASKRAGIAGPVIPRPKPLGVVNFAPPGTQQAASGGIMGYNLGGYADGGNPRLLKGPGDGMSDNIPAVIGRRQPARLADGEFVVPADVVSHLGNGSTDAGAKKLHQMMDKIRMARTGKKKQAPAVKPKKYMPA